MPLFRQWLSPTRTKILARVLKITLFTVLGTLGAVFLLFFVHRGILPVVAWFFPALEGTFYDLAVYGAYRTDEFVSFDLEPPIGSAAKWDDSCQDGSFTFVGPNGPSVPQAGPVILDDRGNLVWMTDEYESVMNFHMQEYRGEKFLTFWTGDKRGSQGQGDLLMLNSNYEIAHHVRAVGPNVRGDLHEFKITPDGTALFTIYNVTQMDLTGMGWGRGKDGWVLDGVFQEVDIETNELLFEWRASDYWRAEDSFYFHPFAGYVKSIPWDFYHINSIHKDSKGNYLISSRHMHAVSYIDGKTGSILWSLGGDSEDFTDLSDGAATSFKWQHHARWRSEEEGLMTLFDNGVAGPLHVDAPYSKGLLLKLDLENMTATKIQEYKSLNGIRAPSQGNLQWLPNGRIIIGWGASPAYSEFNIDGELVCETHLGAEVLFWWERMKSYRVYKYWDWVGEPTYPPSAKIEGDSLYVSWNGATEVRYWELQGTREDPASGESLFESIDIAEKRSFEEAFLLPSEGEFSHYRVVALDGERNMLHQSDLVAPKRASGRISRIIFGIFAGVGLAVGVWYMLRAWTRRRHRHGKSVFHWESSLVPKAFDMGRGGYAYSRL